MKSQRLSKLGFFICVVALFGLDLVAQDGKDSAIYINIEEHLKPSKGIPALIDGKHLTIDGGEIRWKESSGWKEHPYRIEVRNSEGEVLPLSGYFTEAYGKVRMVLGFNFLKQCPDFLDMQGVVLNFMLSVDRVYDIHLNGADEITFVEHRIDSDRIADVQESLSGLVYITDEWNSQPQLLVDCARIDGNLLWKPKN